MSTINPTAHEVASRKSIRAFNAEEIRGDFPILKQEVHGKPLIYLDNAATSQKPKSVIDAIVRYYAEGNSNVHRGIHHLSELATQMFEHLDHGDPRPWVKGIREAGDEQTHFHRSSVE